MSKELFLEKIYTIEDEKNGWMIKIQKENKIELLNLNSKKENHLVYLESMSDLLTEECGEDIAVYELEVIDETGDIIEKIYSFLTTNGIMFSFTKCETWEFSRNYKIPSSPEEADRWYKYEKIFLKHISERNDLRLLFATGVFDKL